ncbi:MAG TPA: response regulator [Anaerolineales bacterium]|nr:response regulator [Anaerolineales bacterium]HLE73593.1 response regulator [Anaerolineales bacterium]
MPKTVMVLEDEPMLFDLLVELLGLEGYKVTQPNSLENILSELSANRPDAVLIDVHLKDANGLDLLSKIRADRDLKGLVVLLSSGNDYRQESVRRGADGFLMKPYMPEDLLAALKQKLND